VAINTGKKLHFEIYFVFGLHVASQQTFMWLSPLHDWQPEEVKLWQTATEVLKYDNTSHGHSERNCYYTQLKIFTR
jgi:hypothetical protein